MSITLLTTHWSHADYDMISMDLCFVDWNNAFQYCFHIEDYWSVFTDFLTQSVNKHVPVVHIHKSKAKQSIVWYGIVGFNVPLDTL